MKSLCYLCNVLDIKILEKSSKVIAQTKLHNKMSVGELIEEIHKNIKYDETPTFYYNGQIKTQIDGVFKINDISLFIRKFDLKMYKCLIHYYTVQNPQAKCIDTLNKILIIGVA
jgi:hypothetical protein